MNSKSSFRNTFKLNNADRPVFIPFVYGLAARLGQIPLAEMTSDASYYAHSLEDAYELFKYDGIVNAYDSTIEAEIFGCEIEWPGDYDAPHIVNNNRPELREVNPAESYRNQVLLETTKRLIMSKGKDVAVIGTVTGPCSLASMLAADTENGLALIGNLLKAMVKSLCELRVDAVFFREDTLDTGYPGEVQAHSKPYTDIYTMLFNLVKFYNCFPAIVAKNIELDAISGLYEMAKPDGLVLLGRNFSSDDMAYLKKLSDSLKVSFGLPLNVQNRDELDRQYDVASRFISEHKPNGFFYVSDGEVPYDIPPEVLHDLVARMQNA